jgi:GDPmannose 4,6-dehydratase
MMRALITGITGQDGSYLAEFLLAKGYQVFGLVRRSSIDRTDRISHLMERVKLIPGDLSDQSSLDDAIRESRPDEVYNLASQSFVAVSWNQACMTGDIGGLGVTRMLNSVRRYRTDARFYQAGSSEMFGMARETPQKETTVFYPRSPYGCAKAYAHYITVNYRESYGMFACCGILFNHESPRRSTEFVTRKVSNGVARIKLGLSDNLKLGNLDAKRDWGYAPEYVEAMWMMLQEDKPDDFVIATGETHSIRELLQTAFDCAGLNWQRYVQFDKELVRPAEVDILQGDSSKAARMLGWRPRTTFKKLVEIMVEADLRRLPEHKDGRVPTCEYALDHGDWY